MEYDALANKHPGVEYLVLFPDQSKQVWLWWCHDDVTSCLVYVI